MTGCMSKKQISCVVVGLCCTAALIAFSVWAGLGGLYETLSKSNKVNVSSPAVSIKDRRGFIFSRSAEHPETVRIVASIATSKPVPINQTNLAFNERWSKLQRPDTSLARLANSKAASQLRQRQRTTTTTTTQTPKSFFDLPDARVWSPALVQQQRRASNEVDRAIPFSQPLNGINWERDSFNLSKLLNTVSRVFGVDLDTEDPHLHANRNAISADRSSWVTLSYLSLSVFLLRQMDRLLKLQADPLEPLLMEERSRRLDNDPEPWTYNSLNLLFTAPGNNNTDIERIVTNSGNEDKPSDYFWAAHNIIKASEDSNGNGLFCIWSAYCTELDNRASLDGVTGTVARMNGIVLKMVTGWLSPSTAMIKLLGSAFGWDGIDCNQLFPTCKPEEAVNYLIKLATITGSN